MNRYFLVLTFVLVMLTGCVKSLTIGITEHPYCEDFTFCLPCMTLMSSAQTIDCSTEVTYGIGFSQNTRLGFIFRRLDGDCAEFIETGGLFGRIPKVKP